MPEAIALPQKRVLGDATNTNPRGTVQSPPGMKKRKIDAEPAAAAVKPSPRTQNGAAQRKVGGSSQPQKSQFEEEVLEKLTQDISGLKENNSEKDQQWERPPLGEFDPTKQNICFQQIDAEEGTANGGKAAIRLFGVTEVCFLLASEGFLGSFSDRLEIGWPVGLAPCYRVSTLHLHCCACWLHERRLRSVPCFLGDEDGTLYNRCRLCSNNNER